MVALLQKILGFFAAVVEWVVDFFEWIIVRWFSMIFDAIIALLSAIPVPDWLSNLSSNIAGLNTGVLYFVAAFEIPTGLTWMLSAYLLRFLIRRIPFIG